MNKFQDSWTNRPARGFTLVELLVVVAVIALLIGILLPALGSARASAWQNQGANNQRQFVIAIQGYANDYDFLIPGLNTSGIRNEQYQTNQNLGRTALSGNSNAPVQNYDWLSPILDGGDLPGARAERFYTVLDRYRDPAMRERLTPTTNAAWDAADVETLARDRSGFAGPSYMMPFTWQFAGQTRLATNGTVLQYGVPTALNGPATVPTTWFPRLTKIGADARKIALADGCANVTNTGLEFSADIFLDPDAPQFQYGAFISDTPILQNSNMYGAIGSGNASDGENLRFAYRHTRRMNAAFFDGHISALTREQSLDPGYWYPPGSVWEGTNADPQSAGFGYDVGDRIQ